MYTTEVLDNGLTIVTTHMPGMQSVAFGIWVGVGARYESKRLNGMSHFVEHFVFKGTKKRTDEQITSAIEGTGGMLNAWTAKEATCFYCQVVKDQYPHALEVFMDMVTNPQFKEKHLLQQKQIIIEEIHMYDDRPAAMVHPLLNNLIWPNQPLGRKILGSDKSIMKMTRDDILGFFKKTYRSGNMVISVAGDLTHETAVAEIKKHLKSLTKGARISYRPAHQQQRKPQIALCTKPTEQSHVCLGFRSFRRGHKDRYAMKVLSTLMGENMSSRLFRTVREKHGLAYSIDTGLDPYLDTGAFVVHGGIINEKLKKALTVILKELHKLQKTKVPRKELDAAKEYLQGQFRISLDKTLSQMIWTGERMLLSGTMIRPEKILDKIKSVTTDDIMRVANKIFVPKRTNLAIVGPFDNEELFRKIIEA